VKIRRPRSRRAAHDVTCREAVALVTAYLDGALGLVDHHKVQQHLGECPHCTEHLRQIRATIEIAGRVDPEDLDPGARSDLIALYRRWRSDGDLC
jgi:predicted anti-sigma-YlaC factor YlaD